MTVDYATGDADFTLTLAAGFTLEIAIQGAKPQGVATFVVAPVQTMTVALNQTTTTITNPGLEFSAATVSNSATRPGELWTVDHDSDTATTDATDPTIDEVIDDLTTPFSVTSVSVETNGGGTTAPQSGFAQRVTLTGPIFADLVSSQSGPTTWTVTLEGGSSVAVADVIDDLPATAQKIMDEINTLI